MRSTMLLVGFLICVSGYSQNKLILIPKGDFIPLAHRGEISDSEKKVYDIKSFRITKFEISNQEFVEFLNSTKPDSGQMKIFCCDKLPPRIQFNTESQTYFCELINQNKPVTNVSWYGADAYCQWKGGRLPTDVEWFYAAAGANRYFPFKFSGSDNAQEVAVFNSNEVGTVGSKLPNILGLYDMTGNVAEWTSTGKEQSILFPYMSFVDKEMMVIACSNWISPQELFLNLNSLGCFLGPQACRTYLGFRMVVD